MFVYTAAQDYIMYFETSPGSDPIATTTVHWQMSCSTGAGPTYNYLADDFFDATIGANQQPMAVNNVGTPAANGAGVVTTLAPGVPYVIFLDATQMASDCSAGTVGVNGQVTLWIHIAGGGSTYETLYISDTTQGAVVI